MASVLVIARLHKLIWALIYSGLFLVLLGLVAHKQDSTVGWSLLVAGACIAAAGVALVWVRSRLVEDVPE